MQEIIIYQERGKQEYKMTNLTKENTANSKIIDEAVYVLKTECEDEISQSSFEKISKILGFKLPFKNGKEFKEWLNSDKPLISYFKGA